MLIGVALAEGGVSRREVVSVVAATTKPYRSREMAGNSMEGLNKSVEFVAVVRTLGTDKASQCGGCTKIHLVF